MCVNLLKQVCLCMQGRENEIENPGIKETCVKIEFYGILHN